MLENDEPMLLHMKVSKAKPGEETVDTIVSLWADIIEIYGNKDTVLVFDSYYFSAKTRDVLAERKIKYMAATPEYKIMKLSKRLKNIKEPGQWGGLYNAKTNECLVKFYNENKDIGIKFVYSNCVTKEPRKDKGPKHYDSDIPIYYLYGEHFSSCDRFNANLKDHTWPYRHSVSHHQPAYKAKEHDFAFSSILQNCVNIYLCVNKIGKHQTNYTNLVTKLADELCRYAMELKNDTTF